MEQEELFHEDWRDALKHVVKALGGYETVGEGIWPTWSRKKAGSWLSDCLNPERPAKLDLEDIESLLRLARQHGIHVGLHHLCDNTDYQRPETVEPEDAKARLQREFIEAQKQMQAMAKRLEKLNG